ncbi:bactofilin family protein [Dechloromonas denitrificans]|jgi:cytoskeletal protein CcmA (bactofilin family)|uniref:bactofilin family protein n=1 Tax=Azonexaceae TaxID=2008795 RepID=UPI001CF8C6D8|nr:polymer-forming cytoskeletal protein [Dechloromonas denitrificans]UCV02936.1 polymer-forming cytoskeletal protein [Dechloromonas denitrificans]UCV07257.1 polymer-forming cytoskeletal protein [Dechloromonas denitrificans]
MFGKKSENKPQGRIDSLIGAGTRVEGSIYFTGGLRIDGEVVGSVEAVEGASASTLVLSEHARVEGAVRVAHLVTNGTVVGPATVTESLEMQSKARIVGDVDYALIEMHQGAVIEGRLVHHDEKSVELKLAASN